MSLYSYNTSNSLANAAGWTMAALIIALIGGIVLYFTFLAKKNEDKFNGFLAWAYDFLNFKRLLAETLLKISYLILALYITLSSFSFIGVNFLGFLLYLVLGNVILRIVYEFLLIAIVNCRNTTEINKKLSKIADKNDSPKE